MRRSSPVHVISLAHRFLGLKSFDQRLSKQKLPGNRTTQVQMGMMIEFLIRGTLTNAHIKAPLAIGSIVFTICGGPGIGAKSRM